MPAHSGKLITIEGIEGVGKSSAVAALSEYLVSQQKKVLVTREPGGTPLAEQIRQLLLKVYEEAVSPKTELLLMFASRTQHVEEVIRPALQAGKWVICDRFTDASYAYQGAGRGMPIEVIAFLEKWIQEGLEPDCTLLLDAPVEVAQERAKLRDVLDRIESEAQQFFARARHCYLARAKQYPHRYHIIDASQPLAQVHTQLLAVMDHLLEHQ